SDGAACVKSGSHLTGIGGENRGAAGAAGSGSAGSRKEEPATVVRVVGLPNAAAAAAVAAGAVKPAPVAGNGENGGGVSGSLQPSRGDSVEPGDVVVSGVGGPEEAAGAAVAAAAAGGGAAAAEGFIEDQRTGSLRPPEAVKDGSEGAVGVAA
ncbi:unnamed protein product, partial [Pylaiella littoralis]